ncbi:amidase domain-containing protein [Tepidibacter mesophilus]|uniref:amidase domain-containing protein n=1 Tax=Tepidibacter mesophilus TaxID=655607 RepID=UPI001FA8C093|nr:amidase domain-containing protein [Tepidibacter mesophilus]
MLIIINKRKSVIGMLCILALVISLYSFEIQTKVIAAFTDQECSEILEELFETRNKALLDADEKKLNNLYDKSTKYGVWAYEHEMKKMKYLHMWSNKQGITFKDIKTKLKINRVKSKEGGYLINFTASTEYKYEYDDSKNETNMFRIGTYHSLNTMKNEEGWCITKEWYTDPFADSLNLENIKFDDIKKHILEQKKRDSSNMNERRKKALEYADMFCGAAADEEHEYNYNKKYRNYNPLGGDCANFASQILYEGGSFRKTGQWNYDSNGATKAWVNAHAFKNYMIYSGRASLIAYGDYDKVYKASYKLEPGDFVAYEKQGKVTHISVVTGSDSKGYSLVNCHNTDRYRVPWDLGWSNRKIKFWLVRVHY